MIRYVEYGTFKAAISHVPRIKVTTDCSNFSFPFVTRVILARVAKEASVKKVAPATFEVVPYSLPAM